MGTNILSPVNANFTGAIEPPVIASEGALAAIAYVLGAADVPGFTAAEQKLCNASLTVEPVFVGRVRDAILRGNDPLGDSFCALRAPDVRRLSGSTYTPPAIVKIMAAWAARVATPARVVDPGSGSGRFLVECGKRFPTARLIGAETDPLAALLARANLRVHGYQQRAEIVLEDYRSLKLPDCDGRTLFIGNPPYVRHHLLGSTWKKWLMTESQRFGITASQLAGLHVHFYVATAAKAKPHDFGTFITAAEWLDVNYGHVLRELFLGHLGGQRIAVIEPTAMPFPDAATTAALTMFEVASRPKTIRLRRVDAIDDLKEPAGGRNVRRERLEAEPRWSHLTRAGVKPPAGYIELGEICRVHRGQVTGANRIWISGTHSQGLPESVLFPTVTKARELFSAGTSLDNASSLKRVIDLPVDLNVFSAAERAKIDSFLSYARSMGTPDGYVASTRKAWWSVGLRQPAPILTTYMARRAPAFVVNRAEARHINIAHGIYPLEPMSPEKLQILANFLAKYTSVNSGRTYAGGLTKFEPREMERLLVPAPENLTEESND